MNISFIFKQNYNDSLGRLNFRTNALTPVDVNLGGTEQKDVKIPLLLNRPCEELLHTSASIKTILFLSKTSRKPEFGNSEIALCGHHTNKVV